MLIHIDLFCCLLAASLAVPQGGYLPPSNGYGSRNSVIQGSALPRRFSVSKTSSQASKYQPGASGSQYQNAGGYQRSGGFQGASGSQYQGAGGYKSGTGYKGSGGYQGASQYQGGRSYQYENSGAQYASEDPYAEPANYDFSYEVNAPEYNVLFGHQESRRDMFAKGSYKVLLPDGRTQLVEYEADQEGYRPTITYQEAAGGYGQGGAGGYSQGGGGYSQGGYSQNGNGGYSSKGVGAGKASYGQKGYSGGQRQGYKY